METDNLQSHTKRPAMKAKKPKPARGEASKTIWRADVPVGAQLRDLADERDGESVMKR